MKNKSLFAGLLMIVVLMATMAGGTYAAAENDIEQVITNGIAWLVLQQEGDGSWNPWGDPVAHTAFAVVKL